MINLSLFLLFAKFGALCFGGGYMIIPLLYHEFVEVNPVFSLEAFGNLLSLSQITPGAVSVNSATYVGFIQNGVLGAVFASIGLMTPTFILAGLAIYGLKKWEKTRIVQGFLKGARLVALAMVLYAVCIFMGMSVVTNLTEWHQLTDLIRGAGVSFGINPVALIICLFSMACLYWNKVSVTKMLLFSGVLGIGFYLLTMVFITPEEKTQTFSFATTDDTPFDCDDCVNGACGAWTNGCVCWRDQLNWSGKSCDEPPLGLCAQNADCPAETYCNIDKNAQSCMPDTTQGACFARTHYAPFEVRKKIFVIARPMMNYFSAQNFCAALGAGWTTVSRQDLECDGIGVGCIPLDYIRAFQKKTGVRGFLWLKDTTSNCQAMYVDVNDGAVYITQMNAVSTGQALCIYKEMAETANKEGESK